MKLRVNFINMWGLYASQEHVGTSPQPSRRMVEVELTPEQATAVQGRFAGQRAGNRVYDEVESMYFVDEDLPNTIECDTPEECVDRAKQERF